MQIDLLDGREIVNPKLMKIKLQCNGENRVSPFFDKDGDNPN